MRLPPTTTVGPFVKFRIVEVGRWYFRAFVTRRADAPKSNAVTASAVRGRLTELPPVRVDVGLSERPPGEGWVVDRTNPLFAKSLAVGPPRATPTGAAGRGCRYRRRFRATGGSRPPVLAGSSTSLVSDSGRGTAATARSGAPPGRLRPDCLAPDHLVPFTGDHHPRRPAGGWWRRRRGSVVSSVSRTWLSLSHVAQL